MRRLALHASALSDTEYDFFTKSLCQIADDDQNLAKSSDTDTHFENISIGVREARAWFRGRYSHLPASTIDGILKLFSPSLSQGDLISGIQFFAALRLVIHAENGKEIDRSFAFVQVEPFERTTSPVQKLAIDSRSPSPPIRLSHAPIYTDPSILPSATSSFYADSLINRPFPLTDAQQYHHQLPLHHPYQRSESSQPPFTHGPLHSENGSLNNLPPLPPRRLLPALSQFSAPPPPPRRIGTGMSRIDRSLSPSTRSSGSTSAFPIAAKPTQHITSTLIKQSLQASKVAQSMKKAEEQLEKERVMQVLKSSSTVSGASPLAGASVVGSSVVIGTNIHNQHQHQYPSLGPFAGSRPSRLGQKYFAASSISSGSDGNSHPPPPLPRRRSVHATPSQQPSPPLSECSLEQVALASPPRHHRSRDTSEHGDANSTSRSPVPPNPFGANIADNHPLPPDPPPTHPDRKGYYVGYQQLPPSPEQPSEARSLPNSQEVGNFEAVYGSISASPNTSLPNSSHHAPSTISDAIPTSRPDSPMTRASHLHSFTQTSSALLPPPMRKRRSESVQLRDKDTYAEPNATSRSGTGTLPKHAKPPSNHATIGHRKSSLSLSSAPSFISYTQTPFSLTTENKTWRSSSEASTTNATSTSSTMGSNVQRTIEALHSIHGQLQPKLDKARYKAEAGLSRRGYMRSTVRSSVEDFPGAAAEELEEKEGLTGEYTSRKGRSGWMDKYRNGSAGTPVRRREPSEVVDDSDEPSSDELDRLRSEKAVNANLPAREVDSFSNPQQRLPRNVLNDSPEPDGEDEDAGRLSRELENSNLQRGWTPF